MTDELHEPLELLKRDARKAAATLSKTEIRFLVDQYYVMQEYRKAAANQVRSMAKSGEPIALLTWIFDTLERIEKEIKAWLAVYSDNEPTGMAKWSQEICGIGPVISAGLLAHIDIEKCETAGDLWAFAGYDPTREWKKGQKRPHNAALKTLCWKIGQSFMKVQANKKDVYGKLYVERKQFEIANNEAGKLADQAAAKLEKFKIDKKTEAYKHYAAGHLPPAHIDARARRWVVKLFLAHWFEEAYRRHHGKEPPLPYAIAHLDHAHKSEPKEGREPIDESEPMEMREPPYASEPRTVREPI